MAMLKSTEAQPADKTAKPGAVADKGGTITPESVQAKMHLQPQQAEQLQRIVTAGLKVMFNEQTHKLMLEQLDGPGTIAQKLGQGIAGLMALLMQESKNSLPPQLLIPAGMILLVHAASFLREGGQSISDQDIGQATNAMVTALLHATGTDPDKLAAMGERAEQAPETVKKGAAEPVMAEAAPTNTPDDNEVPA